MDAAELGAILRTASHDLFRLEVLDYYEPDQAEFSRYMSGQAEDTGPVRGWLDRLRAEKARGLRRRRVRIVRSPVVPYVAYECEWPYVRNARAGEEIRILDLAERPAPWEQIAGEWRIADFWVVDRTDVARMTYAMPGGQFLGADLVPATGREAYLATMTAAWRAAEPFESWWNRHREYHRDRKAA